MSFSDSEPVSIRHKIARILQNFGHNDALEWPEAHPIDLDSLQLVELALEIESTFDIDFRDDLIPPSPSLGDFVDMVESAFRQKSVDGGRSHRRVAYEVG